MENFEVESLLKNLPIYKELIHYINSLDEDVKVAMAYVRVSTDDQTEFSPEAQLEDIIKYCMNNNIMLPKENIFVENGISGRRADKRIAFQKMIAKTETKPKPCDVILVHKFDRFARNREESVMYKSHLRKKLGIDVVAIKEPLPEDKKMALIMESQLEAMGEYYSLNLADEVLKGLRKKAERGEHMSRPPLGYKKIIKEIIKEKQRGRMEEKIIREMVVDENEAKIVQLIFNKFINRSKMREIALYLNKMGIKTKNGNLFGTRELMWILNNPVYIGYMRWTEGGMHRKWDNPNMILKKTTHTPIIDMDTWNKAQEILKENKIIYSRQAKQHVINEHWLRGLIVCGDCGHLLAKNRNFYQCCGYIKGKCPVSHGISTSKLEPAILKQLEYDFKNKPVNINISNKSIDTTDETIIIKSEIEKIEIKEKRVKLAYENGVDTLQEYKTNKERLKNEKKIFEKKLKNALKEKKEDKTKEEIYNHCGEVYKLLQDPNVSEEDKYIATHHLINKIVYDKSNNNLIIYYN